LTIVILSKDVPPIEGTEMLYTAKTTDLKRMKKDMKIYYIIPNHGNEEVVPDQVDIDNYKRGLLTWAGLKLNYLAKIYKPEASEWMKNISVEAVSEDIVLVDEEKDENYSYRKILAELIKNMYTGRFNFKYLGEITTR